MGNKVSMEAGQLMRSTNGELWNSPKFYIFAIGSFFICVTFGAYMHLPRSDYRDFMGWNDFDMVVFVQRYRVSSCLLNRTCNFRSKKHTWIVHGLWPAKQSFSHPEYCADTKFNPKQLVDISHELHERWPAVDGDDVALWEHEWQKRGTCALPLAKTNSQLKYFEMALRLHKRYNVREALETEGIRPNNTGFREHLHFWLILKNAFEAEPVIVCRYVEDGNADILAEVRLCFSKEFDLIDCYDPAGKISSCRDPMFFPETVQFGLYEWDRLEIEIGKEKARKAAAKQEPIYSSEEQTNCSSREQTNCSSQEYIY